MTHTLESSSSSDSSSSDSSTWFFAASSASAARRARLISSLRLRPAAAIWYRFLSIHLSIQPRPTTNGATFTTRFPLPTTIVASPSGAKPTLLRMAMHGGCCAIFAAITLLSNLTLRNFSSNGFTMMLDISDRNTRAESSATAMPVSPPIVATNSSSNLVTWFSRRSRAEKEKDAPAANLSNLPLKSSYRSLSSDDTGGL
mmetsp:Transcript_21834/g.35518  ORF Transcript_21834/g.35518 Transcript_21834/m.35518 type:complete len:200 (+) Transcript_21834:1522-2121(+)